MQGWKILQEYGIDVVIATLQVRHESYQTMNQISVFIVCR